MSSQMEKVEANAVCTELVRERVPMAQIPLTFADTFFHRSYENLCIFWCVAASGSASVMDVRTTSRLTELLPTPPKRSQNGSELVLSLHDDLGCVDRLLSFLVISWLGRDTLCGHAAVTWQLPLLCHGLPQLLDPNTTHPDVESEA